MNPTPPRRTDDTQTVIPDFVIETMARRLLPKMQEYFASPEGQAVFEESKQNRKNT